MGDVGLGLGFEESLVASLAETRRRVHDKLGVRREWDAAVAREIVTVGWHPLRIRIVRADLQVDQIAFAAVKFRHCSERFPINALFINAQSTPFWFVLEYLVGKLVDAGSRFAGACVPGDKPASTKLVPLPGQAAESGYTTPSLARDKQEPRGDEQKQNSNCQQELFWMPQRERKVWWKTYGAEWNEINFHGNDRPMR
jgi:hypothetical protein